MPWLPILLGGYAVHINEYVTTAYNTLVQNFKEGKRPGVTDDSTGANAAARLIYITLKNVLHTSLCPEEHT